nr:hypothetical protein [Tanacetum cinerariifolium]
MSRDVITVGLIMHIPLLYRGEYSQWRERFMNYLEEQTDGENAPPTLKDLKFWTAKEKKTQKIDRLARSLLIQGLPNDNYSLIDSNKTAKDLWDALKRQMRGSEYGEQDRKDAILMETKKAVMVTFDPLALVAEKMKVSKRKEKVVVSLDSKGSGSDDFSELKKITTLLAKAFNRRKFYSKLTNNNLRISSTSQYDNKKQEFVKSDDKKVEKKADEKKRDISKVKCYNYKKEGHFAKDCKKAKIKDYNYYKTKMLLAKKDSDEQVLLAEDQACMESSSDSDQEINSNMVIMAQIEKVLLESDESSSSAEETIAEIAYYTSKSESESEFETSEYYDNSSNYGLFFPPTDRSDFIQEEFADELAHIISPSEYDCFYFRNSPDLVEDDHSPLLAYVVWIFLAYLTYPVIPPYLHSFGNEDTIFDPGIAINRFYSFKPGLSHRCGTFKKFNTHRSHLNESPMVMFFPLASPWTNEFGSNRVCDSACLVPSRSSSGAAVGEASATIVIPKFEFELVLLALYTRDFCCSKGNVEDKILVSKLPKNCARYARCGHPVDGSYCQGYALLRKKLEEDLVTYFQYFQNTSESSDDSTNVVNAPREPFVVKQDQDLVSISSESEGILDTMCDVHLVNNPTPLEAKDHFEIVINSNDDYSSSDEDFLYNKNIEYVEASPHDSELFPPTNRSDFIHEEFADELAHIISPSEYDCFYFRNSPDLVEDDHSPLLAYVVWIFLAYLTYPVIPPYLHSFGNEDTIFDPGIAINRFYSFKPGLSHRCGTFKKFNTHRSHLNESPMVMLFSTCFLMEQ